MRRRWKTLAVTLSLVAVVGSIASPSAAAPEKIYSLTAPPTVTAATTTIPITIKNEVPNGNSTINSLIITATGLPGLTITAASPGTATISPDGQTVSIRSFTGIKPLRAQVFTLTVVVPPADCDDGTITWGGSAFTGNALGGDSFRLLPPPASQVTTQAGDCSTITVTKYGDENVNGTRDEGEPALEGWEFTLSESGSTVGSPLLTGPDGTTSFTVLPGHTYTVCETDDRIDQSLAGWEDEPWFNTEPGGDACEDVTTSSSSQHDLDFGNAFGTLGCDAENNTISTDSVSGEVTVTRLANTDGEVPCVLKPASLAHTFGEEEETVTFLVTGTQNAAYMFQIDWAPVANTNPPVAIPTTIDLPGGEHPMEWCVPDGPDLNDELDLPPGEVGCIVDQTWNVFDADHIFQTETIYLEADIVFSKKG